jgi:hypothetical protein
MPASLLKISLPPQIAGYLATEGRSTVQDLLVYMADFNGQDMPVAAQLAVRELLESLLTAEHIMSALPGLFAESPN